MSYFQARVPFFAFRSLISWKSLVAWCVFYWLLVFLTICCGTLTETYVSDYSLELHRGPPLPGVSYREDMERCHMGWIHENTFSAEFPQPLGDGCVTWPVMENYRLIVSYVNSR